MVTKGSTGLGRHCRARGTVWWTSVLPCLHLHNDKSSVLGLRGQTVGRKDPECPWLRRHENLDCVRPLPVCPTGAQQLLHDDRSGTWRTDCTPALTTVSCKNPSPCRHGLMHRSQFSANSERPAPLWDLSGGPRPGSFLAHILGRWVPCGKVPLSF